MFVIKGRAVATDLCTLDAEYRATCRRLWRFHPKGTLRTTWYVYSSVLMMDGTRVFKGEAFENPSC